MKKVIVTIKTDSIKEPFDVEIIAESHTSEILEILCEAYKLGNSKNFNVFATPPGRLLNANETLEEAGVWNGAILTLRGETR